MMKRILSVFLLTLLVACRLQEPLALAEGTEKKEQEHAAVYVMVMTDTQFGWLPLPDTEEKAYSYPLRQLKEDGTVVYNIIRVTKDGFWVEEASCDNQDCVHQGTVTLENRATRVLGSMVICLPNHLTLTLMTWEEIEEMMSQQAGD